MKSAITEPDIMAKVYGKRLFMNRRMLFKLGMAGLVVRAQPIAAKEETSEFPFQLSKSEWKARLTAFEFAVMREESTERAFTYPLNSTQYMQP